MRDLQNALLVPANGGLELQFVQKVVPGYSENHDQSNECRQLNRLEAISGTVLKAGK